MTSAKKKKKILLVDDSDVMLLTHKMVIGRTGLYELIIAKDGQQAVERAVAERPDLILLDVVMPRMTGLEALEELRSREETRETPIIMVTTRSEAANVEQAYRWGCNDYVTKPVDPVELIAKIESLLGGRPSR